ncbi:hypothetical protein JL193_13350 [Polaribacter batillariae]|uniref:DUF1643 domain-containing protein n=1 Tax=Polaribacter batillariae TaxID=2808900 RepID=A0ABX7SUT4_9FLAO|nr:hypothetical protein [Polaribacter batillariae]QTD37095.1 hypothetical protein JL193_13350 [Polaribacter batillariae]
MKDQFNITGIYYKIGEFKFRKVLNIKKKNSKLKTPDLMVVMMNPGSSEPLDGIDDSNIETLAKPDNTQSQIMKVMLKGDLEYARVLNLSDIREAKSNIFYPKIKEMESLNIPHSIFQEARQNDFSSLWVKNVTVVFGWGVNTKLKSLALKAIEKTKVSNPIGIQKPNFNWAYYHPLPPNTNKQKGWLKSITTILLERNQ